MNRLVEVLPRFRTKRQAVEISQQIERDVSAYLVTTSARATSAGFIVKRRANSIGVANSPSTT
jgi:hypothetical protein